MSNRTGLNICLAALLAAAPAGAADLAGRWGATLHGEWTSARGQEDVRHRAAGSVLGLGGMAAYNFTRCLAAGASYTNIDYQGELRAEPIEAILIARYPMASDRWAPYARLGGGISRGLDTKEFDAAAASAALGLETYIGRDWAVGVEGLYRYISDTGESRLHSHNVGIGLNLSWFFPRARPRATPLQAAAQPAAPVDSDGDGVPDYLDKCPDTPRGAKVDKDGCLLEVSMRLDVLFDTDKAEVKPEYYPEIKRVADFLKRYPRTWTEIEGHTDDQGTPAYNLELSQKRADAVRQVLIDRFGISPDRLTARGYGASRPIADNSTEEGRRLNRRVVATLSAVQR